MIFSGTGHRPDKLGGFSQESFNKLIELCETFIEAYRPTHIISGMALGFDQALAQAAINGKIPFTAAIPCKNQENRWPEASQKKYKEILKHSTKQVILSEHYTNQCMQERNIWMVNNCDKIVALYDGSPGGTGNCILYASQKKKDIVNLWNVWKELY